MQALPQYLPPPGRPKRWALALMPLIFLIISILTLVQIPIPNLFVTGRAANSSDPHSLIVPADAQITHTPALTTGLAVYVFSSGNATADQAMLDVISASGNSPTLGVQPGDWTGTQAILSLYNAVILQNSHNWSTSLMPEAGQDSLVDYVQNGGGLITGEWFVYNFGHSSSVAPITAVLPAFWTNWGSLPSTTYTLDTPDATINAGLPISFTFSLNNISGSETYLEPKPGAISFYTSSGGSQSGLVGWDAGSGRVASFSNFLSEVELANSDLATLFVNTLNWVEGQSTPPNRIFLLKKVGLNGTCNSYQLNVEAGTEVTYCYEVINQSTYTLTRHTLLDDKLGTLLNSEPFTLTLGQSYSLTATAVITEDTLNVATWIAEDAGGTIISDTAQAFVSITETDIGVQKWVYAPSAVAGDELTYYIYYYNWTNIAANNVWLTDTLPAELSYVDSGVHWSYGSQNVVAQSTGNVVSWSMAELPPYSYGYLYLTVQLTDTIAVGTDVVNEVAISSTSADSNLANNTYQSTVQVAESTRDLSVQKSVYGVAQPGNTLGYYIYYQNIGNQTADTVLITDTLPSNVTYNYYYDYYNATSLQIVGDELVWSLPSLSPYQWGYIYVNVTVTDTVTVGTVLTNTINISSADTDIDLSNNSDAVTSTVIIPGSITGTVKLDDGTPIPGAYAYAYSADTFSWGGWGWTDASGNYEIDGLPAGNYYVYFYSQNGNQIYDGVTTIVSATVVTVVSDQTTPNINAQFHPPVPPVATASGGGYIYADPATGELSIWFNPYNPSDLTLSKVITCSGGITPTNVTLVFDTTSNGTFEYPMTANGTTYSVTVPAGDLTSGDFSIEYDCGGTPMTVVVGHGLIDPSGFITDAVTGDPIVGATVQLFTIDDWVPKSGPTDVAPDTCHTIDSRPSIWNEMPPAPQIGRLGNPLADPQEIDPTQNPLLTDETGYYAWDVAAGCWYIVVTAEGYETRISPVVGVPPEVTDLHLTMNPIGSAEVAFSQVGFTAVEENGTVLVNLTLSDITQSDVTVNIASSDGTAQAGIDYVAISQTVTIPAGQPSKSVTIHLLDDAVAEGSETFSLTLSSPDNAVLGPISSATVTITDGEPTETATVTLAGTGSGTVSSDPVGIDCPSDCDEDFGAGMVVTLTATANVDSSFTGWSGACTGTGDCVLTMDAAQNVTATFTLNTYLLTVSTDGTGSGTVSGTGISCGADCTELFDYGTAVTLTANPDADSTFAGWSGACTGTGDCVITMDMAQNVTATFTLAQEVGYSVFLPFVMRGN